MQIDHLSWSRENTFAKCGQQYLYSYVEGIKRPPGVAQIRGQAPHRSIEADLGSKMKTGQLLPREQVQQIAVDHVNTAFKGEVSIDGEFEGMSIKEAKAVCQADVRLMAWEHHDRIAPEIDPTALELHVRVAFPELPVPYEGILDIIDAGEILRDTKTKRKAPEKNFAHTSEQLTVYWGLHSAYTHRPPRFLTHDVLWVTPGGKIDHKVQATERNADDWQVKIRRSLSFLGALEKEIFVPAPVDSWACSPRWCGYTGICPYYAGRPRPTS